jgi:hypothetical protein
LKNAGLVIYLQEGKHVLAAAREQRADQARKVAGAHAVQRRLPGHCPEQAAQQPVVARDHARHLLRQCAQRLIRQQPEQALLEDCDYARH